MSTVVVYLDRDRIPWRRAYFKDEATRLVNELGALGPFPMHTGKEFVELAATLNPGSVDHLIVCGHGGSRWLLHPRTGISTTPQTRFRKLGQVDIGEAVAAWSPVLTKACLLSLAACLCSRSPIWWLKKFFGRILSGWGRRGYERGGQASISARFRDLLCYFGHRPKVRGHRTAGDLLRNSILAEHVEPVGSLCTPLSMLALPNVPVGIGLRRWWTRTVTGRLAERWLLGDDSVVEEIAGLWESR